MRVVVLLALAVLLGGVAVTFVMINLVSRICCWLGVHEPADVVTYFDPEYDMIVSRCARCNRLIPGGRRYE